MTVRFSPVSRAARTTFSAAAFLLAAHAVMAQVDTRSAPPSAVPDRAAAYYHDGLAHMYEEMATNNGRPDYAAQAIEEYKLALNADPDNRYLQNGLADLYFKLGRIREAVTAAQDQIKRDPNDLEAHQLLGKVYLRSLNDMQGPQANEMLQLAIAEYEKLAQLQPKDVDTHLLLGQLYGLNHDTAKAQAQFKLAQGLDSNSEEAVLNMARLYTEEGEQQKAIDALKAIPADDRSARVNEALGATYDSMKDSKDAAAAYKAALEDDGGNADVQRALATDLMTTGDVNGALSVYRDLVKQDPADAQSEIKISEILRGQGKYQEALDALNKAKATSGGQNNLEVEFDEAALYDSMGKYDLAVSDLQTILTQTQHLDRKYTDSEKNNRAIFLDRLGAIDREENKTADAVGAYKQIVAMGGDEFVLRGYEGEIDAYRDAHQWKDAVNASAELAKLYPANRAVQLTYAYQLADTGSPDQGLTLAKAQLNNSDEDENTHVSIANIDMRLHRSADALAQLDKAQPLAKEPEQQATIALLRATVLDRDKQYAAAETQYRKALELDPNNASVLNDLGYMLADEGVKLPEALAMVKKALALDPQNGAYLDSLGWVYFKLGQYADAETNLHQAIDRTPTDPSIHDHLGQVYEKTGKLQLAVEQWQRSMTEYARSLPADADPADVAKVKHELDAARTKLARNSAQVNKKS